MATDRAMKAANRVCNALCGVVSEPGVLEAKIAVLIDAATGLPELEAHVVTLQGESDAAASCVGEHKCAMCGSHLVSVDTEQDDEAGRKRIVWTCCNGCEFQWCDWLDEALDEEHAKVLRAEARITELEDRIDILNMAEAEMARQRDATLARVAELEREMFEDRAVCLCGCPPEDHEMYEEGESCSDDTHGCLRVAVGVAATFADLRAERDAALRKLEAAKVALLEMPLSPDRIPMPADLCSHCLETEAALAERDREIERVRQVARDAVVEQGRLATRNAAIDHELSRLREREAKWRELLYLEECNSNSYWSPEDGQRASQLRRELGLDGEQQT